MYGLILEGIADAFRRKFGEEIWDEVRKQAGVKNHSFNMHKTYSETVIPRIAKSGSDVTGRPIDEIMELCGYSFIAHLTPYGYDRVIRVLGRHLRDLLSGLDNLHEYLRISYPKLKPPSFFCENESRHGLTLHYRSKRRGFTSYVIGLVTQLAKTFYNHPLEIELLSEDESMDMTHVVLKLHFDNIGYSEEAVVEKNREAMPVSSDLFFDTFPFHLVFGTNMQIISIGSGLAVVLPHLVGMSVDEMFLLSRPPLEFSMENVRSHLNNVFVISTVEALRKTTATGDDDDYDPDDKRRCLKLKGQMIFMEEWNAALFLGTPIMENLDRMFDTGLFINDLSMHDASRDLVLTGTQGQAELKMALETEKEKSVKLEAMMKTMGNMDIKVSSLLTNQTPRMISRSILKGENLDSYCCVYDSVTILVSDVQGFGNIIDRSSPLQTMGMLNLMLEKFDKLVDKHKCCKIEARNNELMVCSGAPVNTKYHAVYICDLAIDMIAACQDIGDPAQGGSPLKIKIGIMTGSVSGGIIGNRVPVFDIVGENVAAASKIASAGMGGKIHVGEQTKNEVEGLSFEFEEGGTVDCQNKGAVKTFWLNERAGGSATPLSAKVDETADVGDNISGFIPEEGKPPKFKYYTPVKA